MVLLYDVFSVLRPDGLGPHFLPREGECGTPPYDVFSVLGPFPLRTRVNVVPHFPSVRCFFRTRVNVVNKYHISGRSGLTSRWNGSTFLPREGECGTPPYDVFSVLS